MEKTKFEKDLEAYFPRIYKLHQLSKWDKFLWDTIYQMLDMADNNAFGEIRILYQHGKINHVYYTMQITASDKKPDDFSITKMKESKKKKETKELT